MPVVVASISFCLGATIGAGVAVTGLIVGVGVVHPDKAAIIIIAMIAIIEVFNALLDKILIFNYII
jgi:hypothetical protein